jgi:hypothetical protein
VTATSVHHEPQLRRSSTLLTILEQNPQVQWTSLIDGLAVQSDTGGEADKAIETEDEFTTFKL